MRSKFLFLGIIGIVLISCSPEQKKLLTSRIEYDVLIGEQSSLTWNQTEKEQFLICLINGLKSGMAKDENDMPLTSKGLIQFLLQNNAVPSLTEDTLEQFLKKHIVFLRFREKWEYDPRTFHLSKKVIAVAPGIIMPAQIDSLHATTDKWLPLWWIPVEEMKGKVDVSLNLLLTYTFVRNDVDDVLETYERIDPWFCQLPRIARDTFYSRLLNAFENKKFTFYNMMFQPFSSAEYDHYFLLKKTLESDSVVQNIFHPSFFARIKFIERWEISFSPFAFRKTVLAFAPSQVVFDLQYDMVKGYKPLFWVVQDTSILKNAPEHEYWF